VLPVNFADFDPTRFQSLRVGGFDNDGIDSCHLLVSRCPEGKGTSIGLHTHVSDQFYFTLTGKMNFQLYDKIYQVRPNTLVFIPAGAPHWNFNTNPEEEIHVEMIIPGTRPGFPLAMAVKIDKEAEPAEDPEQNYIRPVDMEKFDLTKFSVQTLATRETGSSNCRINIACVPAGKAGPPLHTHPVDQIYYVLTGTMNVQIGNEKFTAGPNTYVFFPRGVPHCNWNETDEPETHLVIFVPETSKYEAQSQSIYLS
jgi:mannose-6-phosphate isomerase-like protein (cupin superfamily)